MFWDNTYTYYKKVVTPRLMKPYNFRVKDPYNFTFLYQAPTSARHKSKLLTLGEIINSDTLINAPCKSFCVFRYLSTILNVNSKDTKIKSVAGVVNIKRAVLQLMKIHVFGIADNVLSKLKHDKLLDFRPHSVFLNVAHNYTYNFSRLIGVVLSTVGATKDATNDQKNIITAFSDLDYRFDDMCHEHYILSSILPKVKENMPFRLRYKIPTELLVRYYHYYKTKGKLLEFQYLFEDNDLGTLVLEDAKERWLIIKQTAKPRVPLYLLHYKGNDVVVFAGSTSMLVLRNIVKRLDKKSDYRVFDVMRVKPESQIVVLLDKLYPLIRFEAKTKRKMQTIRKGVSKYSLFDSRVFAGVKKGLRPIRIRVM